MIAHSCEDEDLQAFVSKSAHSACTATTRNSISASTMDGDDHQQFVSTAVAMADRNDTVHEISKFIDHDNFIDRLLSKELLKLSAKDRNAVDEEIHGVSTLAPKESPEMLAVALFDLSEELKAIPDHLPIKSAYIESQILTHTYVNEADFRLRFLRCELFDARKAAIRMVKFLDFAVHLFGPIVLERPMRISDFTRDEKKVLRDGNLQMLPYRDQSGRPVVALVGDLELKPQNRLARWKTSLYLRYCMSGDIETQQKGYTSLVWIGTDNASFPWEDLEYHKRFTEAEPVRKCSIHWCLPPDLPSYHPIHPMRYAFALSHEKDRSRVKFHVGVKVELMYKLKTYGIPVEWIPTTDSGNIKTVYLKQWMKFREHLEKKSRMGELSPSDASSITYCPRSTDVIFRGGTSLKSHPGNAMFENMIESRLQAHQSAPHKEKIAITKAMIRTIQEKGRFLKWDNRGWWKELHDAPQIHLKVAEKVRFLNSKLGAPQQSSRCSTVAFQNQDNSKRRKVIRDDSSHGSCCSESESCCML